MFDLLRMKAKGLDQDVIDFTRRLIRIPSYSLHEHQLAEPIVQQMAALGYDESFCDQYGNAIGILWGRANQPAILLAGHMDTVNDEDSAKEWMRPCFTAAISDRCLYGLGAADCKGGIATQIYAGALLKRSLLPLQGTIVVAATVAEENGLSLGFRHLLARTLPDRGLKPAFTILSEPTDLDICHGHDGWMEVSVHITAKTPLARALSIERINEELHVIQAEDSTINLTSMSFNNGADGSSQANLFLYHPLNERETIDNTLRRLSHRLRLVQGEDTEASVSVKMAEEDQLLHVGTIERVKKVVNAWSLDPYHPLVARARGALQMLDQNARVRRWSLKRPYMGTAGSVAMSEFGIPTIGYGPGREDQAHATDEHVELANLRTGMLGTAAIAHALVGIPVYGWTTQDP